MVMVAEGRCKLHEAESYAHRGVQYVDTVYMSQVDCFSGNLVYNSFKAVSHIP